MSLTKITYYTNGFEIRRHNARMFADCSIPDHVEVYCTRFLPEEHRKTIINALINDVPLHRQRISRNGKLLTSTIGLKPDGIYALAEGLAEWTKWKEGGYKVSHKWKKDVKMPEGWSLDKCTTKTFNVSADLKLEDENKNEL